MHGLLGFMKPALESVCRYIRCNMHHETCMHRRMFQSVWRLFLSSLLRLEFFTSVFVCPVCFASSRQDPGERQLRERDTDMETANAGAKGGRASEEGAGGADRQGERGEAAESDSRLEEAASRQEGQRGKKVFYFSLFYFVVVQSCHLIDYCNLTVAELLDHQLGLTILTGSVIVFVKLK